jgi:hypothetical protein
MGRPGDFSLRAIESRFESGATTGPEVEPAGNRTLTLFRVIYRGEKNETLN